MKSFMTRNEQVSAKYEFTQPLLHERMRYKGILKTEYS